MNPCVLCNLPGAPLLLQLLESVPMVKRRLQRICTPMRPSLAGIARRAARKRCDGRLITLLRQHLSEPLVWRCFAQGSGSAIAMAVASPSRADSAYLHGRFMQLTHSWTPIPSHNFPASMCRSTFICSHPCACDGVSPGAQQADFALSCTRAAPSSWLTVETAGFSCAGSLHTDH